MRSAPVCVVVVVSGCFFAGCPESADGLPPPVPPECAVSDECDVGNLCVAGNCVEAPGCLGIDDWPFCRDALNAQQAGLGRTAVCEQTDAADATSFACRPGCEVDDDCRAGALCTDFGRCVAGLKRTPATTLAAHAALLAGVGEVPLDVPVTTSLGGLSLRAGPGDGAWADGMDASIGHLEGLSARAAFMDAGDGRFLVVRLPIIFPTQALTEAIAERVQERTGTDVRDALLVSATHTHSGPARFLPLLEESEGLLGPFGIGTFRQEVFDRIADSAADACVAAIDSAAPARLGWTIAEAFDDDDAIAVDRRVESPPFDDNRALLVRVDDDAGAPLFVLFGFGIHPTENGGNWATSDVVGGLERAVEAHYAGGDRVVPALFLQGNGGSMAPTAGGHGFAVPVGNDYAGAVFVDRVKDQLDALETKSDVVVKSRAHRFSVTAPLLGYQPGDWVNNGTPPFGGDVTYGGMNCFKEAEDAVDTDGEYSGHIGREQMGCGVSLHTFLFNHPPTPFQRTQINAIDLDGLSVVTLPGELSMEGSWDITANLQKQAGLDPLSVFTLGYSNDHLMYLLPTSLDEDSPPYPGYLGAPPSSYPPFAYSVFRGGFEADTTIWGDLMGDYMKAHALLAWQRLQDGTGTDVENAPTVFSENVKEPIRVDDSPDAGAVVADVAAAVARRAGVDFVFKGGDVAVEGAGPVVTLVDAAADAPVRLASGRPFSTQHAVFPLHTKREPDGTWLWTAHLELPLDLPAGRYRLDVVGHAQVGGAVVDYDARSADFSVDAGALEVVAAVDGADVVVHAGWAQPPPFLDDRNGTITGSLQLVDVRVPQGRSAPIGAGSATLQPTDGAPREVDVVEVVEGGFPVSVARFVGVAAGSYVVTVVDAVGNAGSASITVE